MALPIKPPSIFGAYPNLMPDPDPPRFDPFTEYAGRLSRAYAERLERDVIARIALTNEAATVRATRELVAGGPRTFRYADGQETNDLKIDADGNPVMIGSNIAQKIADRLEPSMKAVFGHRVTRNGSTFTFTADGMPTPTERKPPEPLTYAAFDAIVRKVVSEECPRANVVTDTTHEKHVLWLECGGIRQHATLLHEKNERAAEELARATCRWLVLALGEREAGKAGR
jgi:hypothetical protein